MSDKIKFSDWQKLDIRAGTITNAEEHPDADKLCILEVDIGEKQPKRLVAGIKQHYSLDELIGKKVVVFCNLEPAILRGVRSEGMILAAVDGENISLLTTDEDVENGAKVR